MSKEAALSNQIEGISAEWLSEFAEQTVQSPPASAEEVVQQFSPLFQRRDYDPRPLFPRLLDALKHSSVAAVILDLCNFVTRQELVDTHPASDRVDELALLLSGIVGRLAQLEASPPSDEQSVRKIGQQVAEGIPVAVAICDALAQIGDRSVVGKLYQAMEVRHRRLQTEAAGALAKLGESAGEEMLVKLAAEPVARLRVLAYAKELNLVDKVDAEYFSDEAQAEAELALWLAQPENMGVPPDECRLFDQQTLYWPGYDDPVDCFLFQFSYRFPQGDFDSIGIAGPMTHAFAADLSDLPPDDIYAAFAGWQAEHEEIYEFDVTQLTELQRVEVTRLERRLHDEWYTEIQPCLFGMFFGDRILVAKARKDGVSGIAIVDEVQSQWFPETSSSRPLGVDEAYCIHKGRKLLRSFN